MARAGIWKPRFVLFYDPFHTDKKHLGVLKLGARYSRQPSALSLAVVMMFGCSMSIVVQTDGAIDRIPNFDQYKDANMVRKTPTKQIALACLQF